MYARIPYLNDEECKEDKSLKELADIPCEKIEHYMETHVTDTANTYRHQYDTTDAAVLQPALPTVGEAFLNAMIIPKYNASMKPLIYYNRPGFDKEYIKNNFHINDSGQLELLPLKDRYPKRTEPEKGLFPSKYKTLQRLKPEPELMSSMHATHQRSGKILPMFVLNLFKNKFLVTLMLTSKYPKEPIDFAISIGSTFSTDRLELNDSDYPNGASRVWRENLVKYTNMNPVQMTIPCSCRSYSIENYHLITKGETTYFEIHTHLSENSFPELGLYQLRDKSLFFRRNLLEKDSAKSLSLEIYDYNTWHTSSKTILSWQSKCFFRSPIFFDNTHEIFYTNIYIHVPRGIDENSILYDQYTEGNQKSILLKAYISSTISAFCIMPKIFYSELDKKDNMITIHSADDKIKAIGMPTFILGHISQQNPTCTQSPCKKHNTYFIDKKCDVMLGLGFLKQCETYVCLQTLPEEAEALITGYGEIGQQMDI